MPSLDIPEIGDVLDEIRAMAMLCDRRSDALIEEATAFAAVAESDPRRAVMSLHLEEAALRLVQARALLDSLYAEHGDQLVGELRVALGKE